MKINWDYLLWEWVIPLGVLAAIIIALWPAIAYVMAGN